MLDHITSRVIDGNLVIADAPTTQGTKGPISVSVAVPSPKSVTITRGGSGIITVNGIDGPTFTVTVPGDGVLRASETVARLDVRLGGAGDPELDQLVARDALPVVSGSGRIVITQPAAWTRP
jgi:hypothetical protein